eukprot:scaffold23939_cov16-Prasinocladus_malaysianus.AAC.1
MEEVRLPYCRADQSLTYGCQLIKRKARAAKRAAAATLSNDDNAGENMDLDTALETQRPADAPAAGTTQPK